MSTDAIVLLKNDHQEIRKLFSDFPVPGRTVSGQPSALKTIDAVIT